jgi:hypothetical protein
VILGPPAPAGAGWLDWSAAAGTPQAGLRPSRRGDPKCLQGHDQSTSFPGIWDDEVWQALRDEAAPEGWLAAAAVSVSLARGVALSALLAAPLPLAGVAADVATVAYDRGGV